MENDKQNLITRVITYLVIFLGVLFTLIVMSDDNPKEMNPEQIKVAAFNNDQFEFEKDEKGRFIKDKFGNYTYKDLDNDSTYSKSEGEILRNYQTSLEQTLDSHVFTLTFFSIVTVTATFSERPYYGFNDLSDAPHILIDFPSGTNSINSPMEAQFIGDNGNS